MTAFLLDSWRLFLSYMVAGVLVLGSCLALLALLKPRRPGMVQALMLAALGLSAASGALAFTAASPRPEQFPLAPIAALGGSIPSLASQAPEDAPPSAASGVFSDSASASGKSESGMAAKGLGTEPLVTEGPSAAPSALAILRIVGMALGLAWLVGILFLALKSTVDRLRSGRILSAVARPADERILTAASRLCSAMGIRKRPAVLINTDSPQPFCAGIFHPAIHLPGAAAGWEGPKLDLVLSHELAHVKRMDNLALALGRFLALPLWPLPLSRAALAAMELDRESAADALAIDATKAKASDYAALLGSFATALFSKPASLPRCAMASPASALKRIESLLSGRTERLRTSKAKGAAILAIPAAAALSCLFLGLGPVPSPGTPAPALPAPAFVDPLAGTEYRRIQEFGPYADPFQDGKTSFYRGTAMAADKGAPVRSIMKGKVIVVAAMEGMAGKYVIIDGEKFRATYYNIDGALIREGQEVDAGEPIAMVGNAWSNVFKDGERRYMVSLDLSLAPGKEAGPDAVRTFFDPARMVNFTQPPASSGIWNPDQTASVTTKDGNYSLRDPNGGWAFEAHDTPSTPVTGTIYSSKDGTPALIYSAKAVREYRSEDKRKTVIELIMEDGSVITISR